MEHPFRLARFRDPLDGRARFEPILGARDYPRNALEVQRTLLSAGEQGSDPNWVVRKQIEHRGLVGSEDIVVDREKLGDDVVHSLRQHRRTRIEIAHDGQARERRRDGRDGEIGTVLLENQYEPPAVAAPEHRAARAFGGVPGERITVMEQHRRGRGCEALDRDKIAKRELEMMHAVDEAELNRLATEQGGNVVTGEKLITRRSDDLDVGS